MTNIPAPHVLCPGCNERIILAKPTSRCNKCGLLVSYDGKQATTGQTPLRIFVTAPVERIREILKSQQPKV